MKLSRFIALLAAAGVGASPVSLQQRDHTDPVAETTCNGKTYKYLELAAYGFTPSDARDRFGDTLGGIGSSAAFDRKTWKRLENGSYEGIVWTLPDRGWNTEGTLNVQPRIHKFQVILTPNPSATVENPSSPNLQLNYLDTVRLTGPEGAPLTGLDADVSGSLQYPGFPELPAASYVGDGFGGPGPGGKRISADTEGLVLTDDGSFWISDEYGPYVYKFDPAGKMVEAIRPPEAIVPRRNGTVSFSANTAPFYDQDKTVKPAQPQSGRANNQGAEGLTITGDGKTLYVLLQSAATQEGGPARQTNRNARLLQYDVQGAKPRYTGEFVVPLPQFDDPTEEDEGENIKTAAQSEILYLDDDQFFVLARDSGAGRGQDNPTSVYRQVDVFDISSATNIKGDLYDRANGSIADRNGTLRAGIVPATYCPFLDFNINEQLGRFGLRNGPPEVGPEDDEDRGLLNEKWEALALLPVDGEDDDKDDRKEAEEYFLFTFADNDFITQNGYLNEGRFRYRDSSGFNLDNQVLVFKVEVPSFDTGNGNGGGGNGNGHGGRGNAYGKGNGQEKGKGKHEECGK